FEKYEKERLSRELNKVTIADTTKSEMRESFKQCRLAILHDFLTAKKTLQSAIQNNSMHVFLLAEKLQDQRQRDEASIQHAELNYQRSMATYNKAKEEEDRCEQETNSYRIRLGK